MVKGMHDSGERQSFTTGAVRDTGKGKGRFDLLSPFAAFRRAKWVELGAEKYTDRNWEKGIPVSRCLCSAIRHLTMYSLGCRREDHLAAASFNIEAIMHFEAVFPRDNKAIHDMPDYGNVFIRDDYTIGMPPNMEGSMFGKAVPVTHVPVVNKNLDPVKCPWCDEGNVVVHDNGYTYCDRADCGIMYSARDRRVMEDSAPDKYEPKRPEQCRWCADGYVRDSGVCDYCGKERRREGEAW